MDPGLTGQVVRFSDAKYGDKDVHSLVLKGWAIAIEKPYTPQQGPQLLALTNDNAIGLNIYALTSVGEALATILPDHQEQTYRRLFRAVHEAVGEKFHCFREQSGTWVKVPFPS